MNDSVELLLKEIETGVLVGLAFPRGRVYDPVEELKRNDKYVPLVVAAYQIYQASPVDESLQQRLYYLARYLCPLHNCSCYSRELIQAGWVDKLKAIAEEGRELGRSEGGSFEELLQSGRLFGRPGDNFALQVPTPTRGCSASICTNCSEPVAFADQTCGNCEKTFIGPFGVPKLDTWNSLDIQQKNEVFLRVAASENRGQLKRHLSLLE